MNRTTVGLAVLIALAAVTCTLLWVASGY